MTENNQKEYPKIGVSNIDWKSFNRCFLPNDFRNQQEFIKENIIKRYGAEVYKREILGKWNESSMEEKLLELFSKDENRALRRESDIHKFVKDFHKKKHYKFFDFTRGLNYLLTKEILDICNEELESLPEADIDINKNRYAHEHLYAEMAYENNQKKRGDVKMEMKDFNTRMGMVEVKHIDSIVNGEAIVKTSYLNNVSEINVKERTLNAFGINSNGTTEELFDGIISAKIDGEVLIYESEYEIETIDNRDELYDLELSAEILKLELKYKDLSENERIEKKAEIKKLCSMISRIDPRISYSINWTTKGLE